MSSRGVKRPRPPADFYVEFPKAVTSLKKYQEYFVKGVETCRLLIESQIEENLLKINHQSSQIDQLEQSYLKKTKDMEEDFQRQSKARRIDLEQELKSFGYGKAKDILAERDEIAIEVVKLNQLKAQLQEAQRDHKEELESAVRREKERAQRHLASFEKTTKLQQEAAVAKVQAQLEQKDEQIKVLERTIRDQKEEMVAARELVGRVADSQRAPAVHHHGPANR